MACDSSQPCIYFYLLNCFSFHCFLFSLLMVKRFYSAIKIWRTTENKWKVTNPIWFKIQNAIWLLFAECVIMSAIKFASTFWNLEKKQATTQKRRNDSILVYGAVLRQSCIIYRDYFVFVSSDLNWFSSFRVVSKLHHGLRKQMVC